MMRPVVFTGPTTHGVDLAAWPGIDVRPPAACGDVLAAVRAGRQRIGIVDGVFGDAPSVWHKEILFALGAGVEVLGAASMGALRAAECGAFGMRGIGAIHADYASGARTADADVAFAYGPGALGWPPLSVPLVDAEATLDAARAAGALSDAAAAALLQAARGLHFADRTFAAMAAAAGLRETADVLERHAVSRKRADALLLLATLAAPRAQVARPDFVFSDTWFFRTLAERIDGAA
jgi:hypothetical protein